MSDSIAPAAPKHHTGRWITDWNPEDPGFWERSGRRIATRNLVFSIFAENIGFSVWLLWSIVVVAMKKQGFPFSDSQLFTLTAVPALVGATLRLPYTYAVTKFGGRNWTVVSALLLLIPTVWLAICVSDKSTPYWMFVAAAATAGFGGGNFASSMANISFFYPEARKGTALGLNAAGGNIGVAIVQLAVPLVIGSFVVAYAGLMWLPIIIAAALCAWLFMDNLDTAKSSFREQVPALKKKHTWVMSFLYIGTFGSFIGYSAAFPLLIQKQFPEITVYHFAFLGALVGSVARPFGGWLSDKLGGARVTLVAFVVMVPGVLGALQGKDIKSFPLFLGSFLLLFIASGVGNGSTYRMIPAIFQAEARTSVSDADGPDAETAAVTARRLSAAVIGFAGAIGAYGGFLIPRGFAVSIDRTGAIDAAFYTLLVFYGLCVTTTWWFYLRRSFLVARAPSLAHASI